MEVNYEILRTKNFEELKAIAGNLGLGVPEGEKRQTLLSRIMEVACQISPERKKEEVPVKKKHRPHVQTEASILFALKKHIDRGLNVTFDDKSFYLSFGKKQDSGTLYQPIEVIIRCAESLVRTA